MNLPCQDLTEIGMPEQAAGELSGDDRLFTALAAGCHVQNAAEKAGMSERTAYRRLADPAFRSRLEAAREGLRESILAGLADAGIEAIRTLRAMLGSNDENIKLKAAKTLLDSLMAIRKNQLRPTREDDQPGRIVVVLPDDGRDPEITARLRQSAGPSRPNP